MPEIRPNYSITFYSSNILEDAFHHASALQRPHSLCQVPVILAAAAVEAFLNELEQHFIIYSNEDGIDLGSLGEILTEAERDHAGVRLKVRLVAFALTNSPIEAGKEPYQTLDLLVTLRNQLIHSRPIRVDYSSPDSQQQHKLVRPFVAKGLVPAPPVDDPRPWREIVLVPEVARWSCDAAYSTILWIAGLLPGRVGEVVAYAHRQITPFEVAGGAA